MAGTSLARAEQYFLDNAAYFTGGITFDALDSFKDPSETPRSYNGSTSVPGFHQQPLPARTSGSCPRVHGYELQHTQNQAVPVDEAITRFELKIEFTEILAKHPAMAYWDTGAIAPA